MIGLIVLVSLTIASGVALAQPTYETPEDLARNLAEELVARIRPPETVVISVDGDDVYIASGTNDGVRVGMAMAVVKEGREVIDPRTGESLGTVTREIAEIQVVHAQERFSIARAIEPQTVGSIESGMLVRGSSSKLRLAVLGLTASSGYDELERTLPELLTDEIVKLGDVDVVQRAQVATARAELGVAQSGPVSDDSARRLGRSLGIDVLVVGSITETGEGKLVSIRALSVEDETVSAVVSGFYQLQAEIRFSGDNFAEDSSEARFYLTGQNLRLWPVLKDLYGGNLAGTVGSGERTGDWLPISGELVWGEEYNSSGYYIWDSDIYFAVTVLDLGGNVLWSGRVILELQDPKISRRNPFRVHLYMGPSRRTLATPALVNFEVLERSMCEVGESRSQCRNHNRDILNEWTRGANGTQPEAPAVVFTNLPNGVEADDFALLPVVRESYGRNLVGDIGQSNGQKFGDWLPVSGVLRNETNYHYRHWRLDFEKDLPVRVTVYDSDGRVIAGGEQLYIWWPDPWETETVRFNIYLGPNRTSATPASVEVELIDLRDIRFSDDLADFYL